MGYIYCDSFNNCYNNDNNAVIYPNIGIPKVFIVENYEVFQVVKK